MKKLLSDTEITILRDVIKLKPRRPPPEKVDTEAETLVSTTGTGTDDFEDAQDTVDAESKETKEEQEQQEEQEEVEGGGGEEEEKEAEDEEPDTSQVGCFIHYV